MHFLDQAKIYLKSGGGGPGAVSFRREKYVEYGGPDGGNGGKGGDIVFEAVQGLNTLIDFRYSQHFKAARGTHGMGKDRHRRRRRRSGDPGPGRHANPVRGQGGGPRRLHRGRPAGRLPRGRDRGARQRQLQDLHQPRPAPAPARRFRGRRCGSGCGSSCLPMSVMLGLPNAGKSTFINQVSNANAKVGALRLHHAGAQARRRAPPARANSCSRIFRA